MRQALVLVALLSLAGCGPSPSQRAADREAMRQAIESYLPRLAQAYATGDVEPLAGHAAEKEISTVERRVMDLAREGRLLHPTLRQVTLEEVEAWSHSNAYATTVEIWDVEVRAAGSGRVISKDEGQRNRVKYQLARDGDRWLILYRAIQQ